MVDPIIQEVREAGQAYLESFKGDRRAMLADIRRREEQARSEGQQLISLPPKPAKRRAGLNVA